MRSPEFENAVLAPTAVGGILRSSELHFDRLAVGVSFQVRDPIGFSATTTATRVQVRLQRAGGDGTAEAEAEVVCGGTWARGNTPAGCAGLVCHVCKRKTDAPRRPRPRPGPSSTSGVCHGAVTLPAGFCDGLPAPTPLEVLYKLPAAVEYATFAGTVVATPTPARVAADAASTSLVELPSRTLLAGDTFSVAVKSRFVSFLSTAGLKLAVGAGLVITRTVPSPAFKTANFDLSSNKREVAVLLAGRKDVQPAEPQPAPTEEVLATITVKVLGTVRAGDSSTVQVTALQDLRDQKDAQLVVSATSGPGLAYTRAGVVAGAGSVHFGEDSIAGIFGYTQGPSEL